MSSHTSSQGTLDGINPAQLLDDMTATQLKRSEQLTGDLTKERFGNVLYNFLIINPGMLCKDLARFTFTCLHSFRTGHPW